MKKNMDRGPEGAPKITRAEDLLAKMRAGTKEVHEIRMREQMFPVRVLSMDEVAAVRRDAIQHMAKIGGDETDKNVHIQKVTLKLASTVGSDGIPLISDLLLKQMTLDEVRYLYEEYIRVMDAVNPSYEQIPQEEFRALIEALKKKSVGARDCSLLQLRAICTTFVDLILDLEMRASHQDKSSGGAQFE